MSRVIIIAVIAVGAIAVVACIIAAVAIGQGSNQPSITITEAGANIIDSGSSSAGSGGGGGPGGWGSGGVSGGTSSPRTKTKPLVPKRRVWTIALGHDYGAYEYMNDLGYLTGFNYDLISEVCKFSNLDCRTVWDAASNCWNSEPGLHSTGGKGLHGQWYDACMGWFSTVDRIHSFDFTEAFGKAPKAYFYVTQGGSFDESNIGSTTKIGFIDGWAADEKCVARTSQSGRNFLPRNNAIVYDGPQELVNGIRNGEVQAGFTSDESMEPYLSLVQTASSNSYDCFLSGDSLMTRKDSAFTDVWNKAFRKFRSSGELQNLCKEKSVTHGSKGTIRCVGS